MSLTNFIPEVWATGILRNLHLATVFAQPNVCNRDYEGDIKAKGDTVRITGIGAITVSDYTKDTDMAAPQALVDGQTTLVIEKSKYFNFAVDDVDMIQGNPRVMDEAMYEAGYALALAADSYVAGLYPYIAAANMLGSDGAPETLATPQAFYPYLTQLKVLLDQANVPSDGRYVIVPPWAEGVMEQDNRFVLNLDPSTFGTLMNGRIARAAGFDILKSNNVTYSGSASTGNYRIMAGHTSAITFAEQVNKVEAYRPQYRFADAVKGLNLYGAKVVRSQALALLTVTRAFA